ncbi:maleylpyruvate isomerase family mycothiol-dependent enzyme [Mycobacteroides abscessus]|uniref:maleylpyruvate isomerase family mycothiol-dependent enzyme n=1 Tax=Mycobacteroides abscessus TaxID=36809 RepID=UPI000C266AE5|nr:maleylpyruvate isomerase family mycothiol-dependent enzyme [Mycobacteroides abscessus]
MTRSRVRALVVQERRDLADLLHDLSPEDWEAESLCAGWRVRDVIAHLLYEAASPLKYGREILRARGSADRLNAMYVQRAQHWPLRDLRAAFESTIEGGVAARFQPHVALADLLIHHQDIRRPLGRDRVVPEERLQMVLNHPDPYIHSKRRMRGLRWVATDTDWAHGDGPEIQGPGEALVMAVAARPSALEQLSGPGVALLRKRLIPAGPSGHEPTGTETSGK